MASDTQDLEVRVVTWFRVDDSVYDHPKFEDLPDSAVALWMRAGSYCAKHLTDGRISYRKARKLCDNPDQAIAALIEVNLWEDIPGEDSAQFHDWLDWNPSRDKVLAERQKNADRQAAWRERKAAERQFIEQRNGVTHAARNSAPAPPGPTQPDPPAGEEEALFPPPPPADIEQPSPRARPPKRLPADHRFDEFWEAYPHKRDKDQAKRTWAKIVQASERAGSDVILDEVIAGAAYYKLSREYQSGHPKYPSTFLNAGSWRDYCNGPPRDHPVSTALVAIPGGQGPVAPRGHDAKMGRFADTARRLQERRANGG